MSVGVLFVNPAAAFQPQTESSYLIVGQPYSLTHQKSIFPAVEKRKTAVGLYKNACSYKMCTLAF